MLLLGFSFADSNYGNGVCSRDVAALPKRSPRGRLLSPTQSLFTTPIQTATQVNSDVVFQVRAIAHATPPTSLPSDATKRQTNPLDNSFFKTLVDHEVTVELKNDISIRGILKSVDQFLNIKLDDIQVVEELKYPHLVSGEVSWEGRR